jgi:hypothetical protein
MNVDLLPEPRLAFLGYKNIYPFEIEGTVWPSVERYVQGHLVPENLKDKVRLAGSTTFIEKLFKNKKSVEILSDGTIIKKEKPRISFNNSGLNLIIKKAIEAKFQQHTDKLSKTYPIEFTSIFSPSYAKILTEYRNSIYMINLKDTGGGLNPRDDIPTFNEEIWRKLVTVLEIYVKYISEIDGVKKLYMGLYDDALYNMAPKNKASKIIKKLPQNYIIKNLPNTQDLVSKSFTYMGQKFPKFVKTKEFNDISNVLWATFRWQIISTTPYNLHLQKNHMRLRPISRAYRKAKIKAPPLKNLATRTKEYVSLFGDRADYDLKVKFYEALNPIERDAAIKKLLERKTQAKEIPVFKDESDLLEDLELEDESDLLEDLELEDESDLELKDESLSDEFSDEEL